MEGKHVKKRAALRKPAVSVLLLEKLLVGLHIPHAGGGGGVHVSHDQAPAGCFDPMAWPFFSLGSVKTLSLLNLGFKLKAMVRRE